MFWVRRVVAGVFRRLGDVFFFCGYFMGCRRIMREGCFFLDIGGWCLGFILGLVVDVFGIRKVWIRRKEKARDERDEEEIRWKGSYVRLDSFF